MKLVAATLFAAVLGTASAVHLRHAGNAVVANGEDSVHLCYGDNSNAANKDAAHVLRCIPAIPPGEENQHGLWTHLTDLATYYPEHALDAVLSVFDANILLLDDAAFAGQHGGFFFIAQGAGAETDEATGTQRTWKVEHVWSAEEALGALQQKIDCPICGDALQANVQFEAHVLALSPLLAAQQQGAHAMAQLKTAVNKVKADAEQVPVGRGLCPVCVPCGRARCKCPVTTPCSRCFCPKKLF